MNNTRTITFTATKGGTGTSTVAAITALTSGVKTLLVDQSQSHDLAAVVGLQPRSSETPISDLVTLAVGDDFDTDGYDLIVIDRGTNAKNVKDAENYLVTRKCYLALRAAVGSRTAYDGIVVIDEKDRALTTSDVSHVLTTKIVASVPYDARISRSVDAGLLTSRADEYGSYLSAITNEVVPA